MGMAGAAGESNAAARERILEAAVGLFACRGYAGTTVSALCKQVGVAPTAIYWHFESKAGLFAAAVDRASERWLAQLTQACDVANGAGDRVRCMMQGFRTLVTSAAPDYTLIASCFVLPNGDEPVSCEVLDRIHRRSVEVVVQGLTGGVTVAGRECEPVAEMMLAMLDYMMRAFARVPDVDRLNQQLENLQEMVAAAVIHFANKPDGEVSAGRDLSGADGACPPADGTTGARPKVPVGGSRS
ncbi:MAG: TetR/AcrR family transcriptional regulator [Myxococcales bacterium]|nr:TetR/AcrR family transcriptional regulator [Myxococcales bacterium]